MWENVVEGLHEVKFIPCWNNSVLFHVRFIDDVYGIWMPPVNYTMDENNATWTDFKADVNDDHGLEWEFSDRSLSSTLLNMNITIQPDGNLKTILYEKSMALYFFVPPHSAHLPWVLTSHFFGNILRFF